MFHAASPPFACDDEPLARPVSRPTSNRRLVERELLASLVMYRNVAGKRLRSALDAEEIVQIWALRALERADQLRDPFAVRGWLRRVFETTLLDFCRARSRRAAREVPFEIDVHDSAELTEVDDASMDAPTIVIGLLPQLRPDYSQVIYNLDLLDRPRLSVAAELGVTVNNLSVRLHRARAALRHEIGDAAADVTRLGALAVMAGSRPST